MSATLVQDGPDTEGKLHSTKSPQDLKSLIAKLSTEEKATLLAGLNFWETVAVPRLGIPSLKVSDGPNGARGAIFKDGVKAACFPSCVSLAATWDMGIVEKVGKALAQETKTKGASVLLGPTVCPHRHALGGRNFESFSEDPLLAGLLATQYINGLQGEGIGATIKHFVANEQETCRFTIDESISQRALREIYLKPFEVAIKRSKPWAVMTSYNLVNGTHSDMNKFLLEDILRNQWRWDGLVMSDWTGTNSLEESLNAGLDLEMPGPAIFRKPDLIQEAIAKGNVTIETVDKRVEAILKLLVRADKFQNPEIPPEQAIDLPEHSALIRQAGAESIVLLKNTNNVLPLKIGSLKSIAMLGLAKQCLAHGGGSAAVSAHHKISPWEAFEANIGSKVEIKYAEGARVMRSLPVLSDGVFNDLGKPGFTVHAYQTLDRSTKAHILDIASATFNTIETERYPTLTVTGTFKPAVTGSHYLSFGTVGNTTVYINDEVVFEAVGPSADPVAYLMGCATEEQKQYQFRAGQEYNIRIESNGTTNSDNHSSAFDNVSGFRLGYITQQIYEANLIDPAVEAARNSDVALVFVGHTTEWETEGADRTTMDLPANGTLDRLIMATAAVNPNTVVINSTGSPISMPWLTSVAAVVQTWFPGQEAGNSICDVILGTVNPSGKLPVTFPKSLEHTPAYHNFPGDIKTRKVSYEEGIYIGYRHFDRKPESILFPFGFGLSYTSFRLSKFTVSGSTLKRDASLTVSVDVTNTGSVPGREVVQIYVGYAEKLTTIDRPNQQLAGFAKTALLRPGLTETVHVTIDDEFAAYWSENTSRWVVLPGLYHIFVGTSTRDIHGTLEFEVGERYEYEP